LQRFHGGDDHLLPGPLLVGREFGGQRRHVARRQDSRVIDNPAG
jgi:hypothetical protein